MCTAERDDDTIVGKLSSDKRQRAWTFSEDPLPLPSGRRLPRAPGGVGGDIALIDALDLIRHPRGHRRRRDPANHRASRGLWRRLSLWRIRRFRSRLRLRRLRGGGFPGGRSVRLLRQRGRYDERRQQQAEAEEFHVRRLALLPASFPDSKDEPRCPDDA